LIFSKHVKGFNSVFCHVPWKFPLRETTELAERVRRGRAVMNAKWIGLSCRWHLQVYTDSSTGKTKKKNLQSTMPHQPSSRRRPRPQLQKASSPPTFKFQSSKTGDTAPLPLLSEPVLDTAADDSELADARPTSFSTMAAHRAAPSSGGSGCFSSSHESGSGSSTSHSTARWTVTCKSCRS
jgi:hypothetical protein